MKKTIEKCLLCNKANRIPKFGWVMSCYDEECNFEPIPKIEEIEARTEAVSDKWES